MKAVCLFFVIFCTFGFCEEDKFSSYDEQTRIKSLQEEIQIYQKRALYADREAQRIMTQDFIAYRKYLMMREKNEEKVRQLQEELLLIQKNK